MTYKKPEPIPVQVMTPTIDTPGFLHSSVAGKKIVEIAHPSNRWRTFLTVEPHQVKSLTHEQYQRGEYETH